MYRSKLFLAVLLIAFCSIPLFPSDIWPHVNAKQLIEEVALHNGEIQAGANVERQAAFASERGRVRIVNNNVVTDHGDPLRGEHLVFGTDAGDVDTDSTILYDRAFWRLMRDDYHLNTVRLLLSRPPQNWDGDLGLNCEPPIYRCYPLDYVHQGHPQADGKTTLEIMDDMVDLAGEMEMYIIIDYHPVFGYDLADAASWWARVAPRYADRTHVIYEVANEPYPNTNYPSNAIDFQKIIYQEIRRVAPETHLILWTFPTTSASMDNTVERAPQISYQNASIGYHPYGPYSADNLTDLRTQYPIIATEIGGNRFDMTNEAENINVSWIWLDGVGLKPGLENATDTYSPSDITWPADPHAGDPIPTATPTNTPTNTPTQTSTFTPTPLPTQAATSTATPTFTLTPTPSQTDCGPLAQEAENSQLSGNWAIGYDDNASNSKFIYMPDTATQLSAAQARANSINRHQASFCFRVTQAGTYRIRGWVYAADRQSDSFFVTVNGQTNSGHIWDIPLDGSYDADYVSSRGGEDPIEVFLAAGDHVVDIFARETGARLDRLALELMDGGDLEPTPSPSCGELSQEAETGILWGNMQVGTDANARNGGYVASANTRTVNAAASVNPKHRVDYCLTITQSGEYRIVAQAHAADDSSNSFFVQVDNSALNEVLWDIYPANGTYNVSYVNNRGDNAPAAFYLERGDHTLSFILRENGARLDWFSLEPALRIFTATDIDSTFEWERDGNDTAVGPAWLGREVLGRDGLERKLFLPFTTH